MDEALKTDTLIIYGAHLVAEEIYRYLKKRNPKIDVLAFAVTDREQNPAVLEGVPVLPISELLVHRETFVLIAMPEKFHKEVAETLKSFGFHRYGTIGLKGISLLKGREVAQAVNERSRKFYVSESKNDYSWLDLYEREANGNIIRDRHYKLAILTKIPEKNFLEKLEALDITAEYRKILGIYRSLRFSGGTSSGNGKISDGYLNIYMATCHKDQKTGKSFPLPAYIYPLQAGAALTNMRKSDLSDKEGITISGKNASFAEMTAMYWIWKNSPPAKYKGLCHYRRHFLIGDRQISGLEENAIDAVLTTPRLVLNGIKKMFLSDTPVKEDVFENMMQSIEDVSGKKYREFAERYFNSIFYYPNNMLIASEEIFNNYCNWIFPILFQMERHDLENHIVKKNRHIAFAAELLTSLYFSFHKDDYRIAVTDYAFIE